MLLALQAASKLASEYDIRDEIGQGAFGTVSLAAHRATQELVVVKQVVCGLWAVDSAARPLHGVLLSVAAVW